MSKTLTPQQNELIFYTTADGAVHVEVFFQDETFWLSQKRMAELFAVEVQTINYHLKEIFRSKELDEMATIRKIRIVQKEGGRDVAREIDFYNLDAIIAIGYRGTVTRPPSSVSGPPKHCANSLSKALCSMMNG